MVYIKQVILNQLLSTSIKSPSNRHQIGKHLVANLDFSSITISAQICFLNRKILSGQYFGSRIIGGGCGGHVV